MPLVPYQGPVQRLAQAAADPAFHDRVHRWRLDGGADDPDARGLEDRAGRGGEAGVPARTYSLMRPPSMGRRMIRSRERSATG